MNSNQKVLIDLVSCALRRLPYIKIEKDNTNWIAIFEEAKSQDIHPLIFAGFENIKTSNKHDLYLKSRWRKAAAISEITQIQHIYELQSVLRILNQADIPTIALKGLILRYFYHKPEQRTMVDADLLIQKKDMNKVKDLLLQRGYYVETADSKNIHFAHKSQLPIELHLSLTHQGSFRNITDFENSIWNNTIPACIEDIPVLQLSTEYLILHLFLHMTEHILAYGFGLRQLCDLVVLVESKKGLIDWNYIFKKVNEFEIDRFVYAIFGVCKKLFDLEVPGNLYCQSLEADTNLDLLICDILSGGVFGASTTTRHIANQLLHYIDGATPKRFIGRSMYFIYYIFPSPKKLGTRYLYAKKRPLLYPFALIHRFIFNVLNGEMLRILISTCRSSEKSISLFNERSKLLQWLGLR